MTHATARENIRAYWFGGAASGNLLDTYTGAAVAYSFRKLRAYAGKAARLRDTTTNEERDFGFDSSGNFNSTAVTTWLAGHSAAVTKWYDQSGTKADLVQATSGNQPTYTASLGGLPSMHFDNTASNSINSASVALGSISQHALFLVFNFDASPPSLQTPFDYQIDQNNRMGIEISSSGATLRYDFPNDSNQLSGSAPGSFLGNTRLWEMERNASNLQALKIAGSTISSATLTAGPLSITQPVSLGVGGGFPFKGYCSELVMWISAQSSIAAIRSNITSYYGL